jgi:amidophosphoribosyltransferase
MCGIAGALHISDAAYVVRTMLHALQNRGQQSFGIASIDGAIAREYRAPGTVANDLPHQELIRHSGDIAIGHNRYATAANSNGPKNMQPFLMTVNSDPMCIAHNGNFTNIKQIETEELDGTPFVSESDTERFFRLLLRGYRTSTLHDSIIETLGKMRGSCSAVLALPDTLIAVRDSTGNRPLFWGVLESGFVVASETSALDAVGVYEWHEVLPGTLVTFTKGGVEVSQPFGGMLRRYCPFELVYFGQITSTLYGVDVAEIRKDFGRALAAESPVATDIIIGIPDSGTLSAIGFSEGNTSGEYLHDGIIRRHNTGRTFIKAGQEKRERGVADKFGFASHKLKGKRVVVIDDSLVRGTTSLKISQSLRERGAAEVHWRIPSPPVTGPCHYGIATKAGELLATNNSVLQMCEYIGADSLEFLSMTKFQSVLTKHGLAAQDSCFACMDGNYWH